MGTLSSKGEFMRFMIGDHTSGKQDPGATQLDRVGLGEWLRHPEHIPHRPTRRLILQRIRYGPVPNRFQTRIPQTASMLARVVTCSFLLPSLEICRNASTP